MNFKRPAVLLPLCLMLLLLPNSALSWRRRRRSPPPPPPPPPAICASISGQASNGFVACTNSNIQGSRCTIQCSPGFTASPMSVICQSNAQWNGPRLACSAVPCPSAPAIQNGQAKCTSPLLNSTPLMSSTCTYTCAPGWVVPVSQRHYRLTCTSSGTWSGSTPTCIKYAPPVRVSCNSAGVSNTSFTSPVTAVTHQPTFNSSDGLRSVTTVCSLNGNPLKPIERLGFGVYNVTCSGTDVEVQLTTFCNYTINAKPAPCPQLRTPAHGALVCGPWQGSSIFCMQQCRAGYDLPRYGPNLVVNYGGFLCLGTKAWAPIAAVYDCQLSARTPRVQLPASQYYNSSTCSSGQTQLKKAFISQLSSSGNLHLLCPGCTTANLTVYCGPSPPPMGPPMG